MDPKRLRGYIRLACAVAGVSPARANRLLCATDDGGLYEVALPNKRYTGPLHGEWFEDGRAKVGAGAAERFRSSGYSVRRLN